MKWFPKLKLLEWLIIVGLVVAFFVITLTNLTKLPIFVDEAIYLRWAQIAWHDASWRFISLTDGKQPLYTWLVIPFMKVISDPLYAGRMASAFSGLVTVFGMGYLGWLLEGKKTGLIAMILTTLSPYLFFYHRFGVMESTLIAGSIWVCNFSILLARSRRLDIAMILGMITGATILVKSSAMFFLLLIPFAYLLVVDFKKIFSKETFKYLALVLVGWMIAGVMYNVQRLSPWMSVISEKNSFFIVPYDEIFNEFKRLSNNFLDVWRWQIAYTTIPMLLASLYGLLVMFKKSWRTSLFLSSWLFGPMLGTVLLARLFAPRYIVFITPFILFFAAYAISTLKTVKQRILITILLLILPSTLIGKLLTDPIHFPYVKTDEGYVNGWSSGNGAKQIADWAVARIKETGNPLTIYTEGTFGTLPHGIELYADARVEGLTIIGLYPIIDIPPARLVSEAHENPEIYFVLNNTVTTDVPAGLELVASYPKLRDNPMRLYRVISR